MPAKTITVSVISDLTTDQRVIRICATLRKMGFNVFVIARAFNDSLPLDEYPFTATRIKCHFRKGILQYAEFNLKLFVKLLFCKTDYFLANDLDTLIPNYIISKLRRKKLIYDTHEYFTGVPELKHSHLKRKIWKFFENWIFPKLKTVYTVNNSVRDKYAEEYGNKIAVVRNVPVTENVIPIAKPENWKNKIILMLQGAGINEGRGGIELLEAMKYLPENYLLVFIGGGNQWEHIKKKRIEWELAGKVDMIEKLPPSKLKKYTSLATIAFSLDSFHDLNCRYNLPNKIFDYMHAGVPVIATAIPEVKYIVEKYNCGICVDSNAPQTLADAVLNLLADKETYLNYKQNCINAAKELCWENESVQLEKIYTPYL
ncbi:MAG: glycosyltransferase [Ferruginibacter sp.]